jgi:hypothetical protein
MELSTVAQILALKLKNKLRKLAKTRLIKRKDNLFGYKQLEQVDVNVEDEEAIDENEANERLEVKVAQLIAETSNQDLETSTTKNFIRIKPMLRIPARPDTLFTITEGSILILDYLPEYLTQCQCAQAQSL